MCFNPHPRVEGDLPYSCGCYQCGCFNPHPRVEGDSLSDMDVVMIAVSIHTLAWRVTPSSAAHPRL